MDAREYLNRKGVGSERDPDRPNTLEEKAWERARGSGHQRPKSGTPHDWEDWERHHEKPIVLPRSGRLRPLKSQLLAP